MADGDQNEITELTVELLSAYLGNHQVAKDDLATLILSTRAALVGTSAEAEIATPDTVPAVSIRKSLSSPDHIISLIDGKPYKTLKRHLTSHGLTPEEYRARYKLPASYPIVAPAYSEMRRATASRIGLGRKSAVAVVSPVKAEASPKAKPLKVIAAADERAPKSDLSSAVTPLPKTATKPKNGKSNQPATKLDKATLPASNATPTDTGATTTKSAVKVKAATAPRDKSGASTEAKAEGDKSFKPTLRIRTPKAEANETNTDMGQAKSQASTATGTPATSAKFAKSKIAASSPSYKRWPKADTQSTPPKIGSVKPAIAPADKTSEEK